MGRAGDKGDWKGTWAEKVEQIGDEEVGTGLKKERKEKVNGNE